APWIAGCVTCDGLWVRCHGTLYASGDHCARRCAHAYGYRAKSVVVRRTTSGQFHLCVGITTLRSVSAQPARITRSNSELCRRLHTRECYGRSCSGAILVGVAVGIVRDSEKE